MNMRSFITRNKNRQFQHMQPKPRRRNMSNLHSASNRSSKKTRLVHATTLTLFAGVATAAVVFMPQQRDGNNCVIGVEPKNNIAILIDKTEGDIPNEVLTLVNQHKDQLQKELDAEDRFSIYQLYAEKKDGPGGLVQSFSVCKPISKNSGVGKGKKIVTKNYTQLWEKPLGNIQSELNQIRLESKTSPILQSIYRISKEVLAVGEKRKLIVYSDMIEKSRFKNLYRDDINNNEVKNLENILGNLPNIEMEVYQISSPSQKRAEKFFKQLISAEKWVVI